MRGSFFTKACQRAALVVSAGLALLAAGCDNSPYAAGAAATNTLFYSFDERSPRYLDPTASYANPESAYTFQIYEPPYGYHYLKRPYQLVPKSAAAVVKPKYLGKDGHRGEGRAKFKKGEDRKEAGKGDCIDCMQCVYVCPTGIDIRNGTQLECINCTACMDSCDSMMESVGLEKGLIRFVSENGIKTRLPFQWTKRVIAYTILLTVMMGVLMTLLITRKDFEAVVVRQRGTTYQMVGDGLVSNIFEINLINKTQTNYKVELKIEGNVGKIETVVKELKLKKEGSLKERFIVKVPYSKIENGKEIITIVVLGNGEEIQRVKTKFIGPLL